jgi:hypothetical protein
MCVYFEIPCIFYLLICFVFFKDEEKINRSSMYLCCNPNEWPLNCVYLTLNITTLKSDIYLVGDKIKCCAFLLTTRLISNVWCFFNNTSTLRLQLDVLQFSSTQFWHYLCRARIRSHNERFSSIRLPLCSDTGWKSKVVTPVGSQSMRPVSGIWKISQKNELSQKQNFIHFPREERGWYLSTNIKISAQNEVRAGVYKYLKCMRIYCWCLRYQLRMRLGLAFISIWNV